jgi:hypothetical protein
MMLSILFHVLVSPFAGILSALVSLVMDLVLWCLWKCMSLVMNLVLWCLWKCLSLLIFVYLVDVAWTRLLGHKEIVRMWLHLDRTFCPENHWILHHLFLLHMHGTLSMLMVCIGIQPSSHATGSSCNNGTQLFFDTEQDYMDWRNCNWRSLSVSEHIHQRVCAFFRTDQSQAYQEYVRYARKVVGQDYLRLQDFPCVTRPLM